MRLLVKNETAERLRMAIRGSAPIAADEGLLVWKKRLDGTGKSDHTAQQSDFVETASA
jgi:hypothetical protein